MTPLEVALLCVAVLGWALAWRNRSQWQRLHRKFTELVLEKVARESAPLPTTRARGIDDNLWANAQVKPRPGTFIQGFDYDDDRERMRSKLMEVTGQGHDGAVPCIDLSEVPPPVDGPKTHEGINVQFRADLERIKRDAPDYFTPEQRRAFDAGDTKAFNAATKRNTAPEKDAAQSQDGRDES